MSNLDDATAFFTSFFELESEVLKANLGREKAFDALYAQMVSMLADESVHAIPRDEGPDLLEELAEARKNGRKAVAPRQLFAVAAYTVGKRKLFCAFASEPRKQEGYTAFMEKFWADNSMHIIATDFPCPECSGIGKVKTRTCPDCKGKAWIHHTGKKIKFGAPNEVKKLQRPIKPESAQQYDEL